MPISTRCPTCHARVQIPDRLSGKTVKCPKCGMPFSARFDVQLIPAVDVELMPEHAVPPHAAFDQQADGTDRLEDIVTDRPRRQRQSPSSSAPLIVTILASASAVVALAIAAILVVNRLPVASNGPKASTETPPVAANPRHVDPVKQQLQEDREARLLEQRRQAEERRLQVAESARKTKDAESLRMMRGRPVNVVFKEFANFPEEHAGICVRFDNVWLHGDFNRMDGVKDFSPAVSSKDGKYVPGRASLKYASGVVFLISEEFGRPLSLQFDSDKQYGVNLCCEVTKSEKLFLARIYRIETLAVAGNVKDVFEEK